MANPKSLTALLDLSQWQTYPVVLQMRANWERVVLKCLEAHVVKSPAANQGEPWRANQKHCTLSTQPSPYIYIYMDFLSRQGASWHLSRKCVRLYHSAYPGQPFSLRVSCVSKIFTPSEHPVILATSYCWRKSAKSYKTDKMGAVRITSLNPKFNGSHF